MMEENQMSKKLKAVLSFALALVLVMSLGVSAFADSSNAETEKEKEPEIVQIAFNLGTMEPCAVRMRELGYDDIRLDGVSYKADAEDGVIAIQLGDLAAAKLLRENTAKAKDLGIDYAKLYIRGGKVLVKDDTGLSSDEIAALKKAVATLMGSVRVGVNIGDIFDLANGEKVKLRVQVSNFIYPPQKQTQQIKVDTASFGDMISKDSEKFNTVKNKEADNVYEAISAKTPTVTTLYFVFNGLANADVYQENVDHYYNYYYNGSKVGMAKDKDDNNTYYIQLVFSDEDKSDITEIKDLTKTTDSKSFSEAWLSLVNKLGELAKKLLLSTDKEGKNVVKTIDIKNATPSDKDILDGKIPDDYTKDKMSTTDENRDFYTPDKKAEVTGDNGDKAEVTVKENIVRNECKHEYGDEEIIPADCKNTQKVIRRCKLCGAVKLIDEGKDLGPCVDNNNDGICDNCTVTMPKVDKTSSDVNTPITLETLSTDMMNPIVITKQVEDDAKQKNEIPDPADTAGNTEEIKEEGKTEAPKTPETPTNPDEPKTPETHAGSETKEETPSVGSTPAGDPTLVTEPATAPTAKTGDAE